jgi:hypothetical protein
MVINVALAPTAKLQAWAAVRAAWKASGKPPFVSQAVLDAEYNAENTD